MFDPKRLITLFGKDREGNIAIMAAAASPLIAVALALGVDYGHLALQQRRLQENADLAAIVAAADVSNAEQKTLEHFMRNGLNYAVRTPGGLLTSKGEVPFVEGDALLNNDGYATIIRGHYVADAALATNDRFKPGVHPYDAVRVVMRRKGDVQFSASLFAPPRLGAVGVAASQKLAAFSVGSRLLSLNGGILNSVLGGLLGTTVSLKVMDYQALIDADIDALHVLDSLSVDLGLTVGTYDDVLKTEITFGQLLDAMTRTAGVKPTVVTVLRTLENALGKTQVKLKLEDVLSLDPYASKPIGSGKNLSVDASAFDLLTAAAVAANGGKQVGIDLGSSVPGLAALKLTLAIGEPPVGTPSLALGTPGSIVRTAQTRLKIDLVVDGLQAIAGLKLQVPLYLEIANAEAKLSNIDCYGGTPSNAAVQVQAVPGVAEIALGTVDAAAFQHFGTTPRVTKASIIDSVLLKVKGMAHANAGNLTKKTLNFTPVDIAGRNTKTVSTSDTLTSLVQSLLRNLDVDIQILFISLGTPSAIQASLADTLSLVTAPLDNALYNTLLMLGIRIGEADVQVTSVSCQRPVLVQ